MCGEFKGMNNPDRTVHERVDPNQIGAMPALDGTLYTKSQVMDRNVDAIGIGNEGLLNVRFANLTLQAEVRQGVEIGEQVCIFYYTHLFRQKTIIGLKTASGRSYAMPARGLAFGLFWYAVVYPIPVGILAMIAGGFVGMFGGNTDAGMRLGFMAGIGLCWLNAYQFYRAYGEMKAG
jgi:hypothetical protein